MPVRVEYQASVSAVVHCELCSATFEGAGWTLGQTIEQARAMGWKVGDTVECPECQKGRP